MHHVLHAAAGSPAFLDSPAASVLLDTDLRIRAVDDAYLAATRRERDGLIGELLAGGLVSGRIRLA